MQRDRKKPLGPIIQLIKYLFQNVNELTQNQRKKCRQKFQSFKALGSSVISKNQLNKVLNEYGRRVSEEELLQMIEQADPNGYGYVSYEAFEKLVQFHKQKKQQQTTQNIELTFQDVLSAEKRQKNVDFITRISWQYLQKYLMDHFELQINIKSMKTANSTDTISKQEFKLLFS